MIFGTWDLNFGAWIFTQGFRVAFGHGHPLVITNLKFQHKPKYDLSKSLI
jgi:hypothetical protein